MQYAIFILCAIATFVLISDHQKIVSATTIRIKRDPQKYTTKYDNIDIDEILRSQRLLKNYVNCLLDKGPCTPEGKELKTYVPDALETECSKCSEVQKKQAGRVFSYLLQNQRVYWDQLVAKYDSNGIFRSKYEFDENDDYSNLDDAK